ncbi:MAG: hypothetical protein HYX25_01670 [Candidatus Solibacter usitatus]|nr:hypothetical protein [Candidatus Solibacter usitatus]
MKKTLLFAFLIGTACVCAQEPQQPADHVFFNKEVHVTAGAVGAIAIHGEAGGAPMGGATFEYVGTEMGFGGKPVKGAPYSAEGITETTQTLADGNRIVHKTKALLYRDTEGRTRNEQTLGAIGPWASSGNPPKTVFINDPVAGVNYVLNPHEQSADKLPVPDFAAGAPNIGVSVTRKLGFQGQKLATDDFKREMQGTETAPADVKTESLGTQIIEGVQAEGTRTTVTIPAGQIGNEKALQTVSERWYSPELQIVVLRKQSDPRFGDTSYRLVNIQRAEPPASLFEVPTDFTVRDGGTIQFKSVK